MAWLQVKDTEPIDEQFVWGYTGGIELLICRKWDGPCFYRLGDYYRHLDKAERLPVKLWQPLEWPDMPWQDLAQ